MNAPMVVDYKRDGKSVKGLLKPARNGYLYWLSRSSDGIGFVSATNYVKQDVFKSIDPKTGRPTYNEDKVPGTGKKASFCPSLWGGKDWPFEAYNPKTGMVFIPANENHCGFLEGKVQEYVAGKWWTGVDIPDIGFTVAKDASFFGDVQAWDINGGKKVWDYKVPKSMIWGSVLTTGGGLVFVGGTNDRKFRALDAKTGQVLWEIDDQLRHYRSAVLLLGGRQAIHRGCIGMGRRRAVPAGAAQQPAPGLGQVRTGRRRDVGVRRAVIAR